MKWRAFIEKQPWSNSESLRIARMSDDKIAVVQPLTLKLYERGSLIADEAPTLAGHAWGGGEDVRGFLQAIVDMAWQEGIRPAGLEDNRNELKAVRDHLSDMRDFARGSFPSQQRGTE